MIEIARVLGVKTEERHRGGVELRLRGVTVLGSTYAAQRSVRVARKTGKDI